MNNIQKIKAISLFTGVGGIDLAFTPINHNNGSFQIVWANDIDLKCKKTYDLNIDTPKLSIEDIWTVDLNQIPQFDLLLGGFPCQAFSVAGNQGGFSDTCVGGNLFFRIAQILKDKNPPAFLLENVKNLKSHDKGRTFKIILSTLNNLGYHIIYEVLNSMTHGNIPQNRERIFIVGLLDPKIANRFSFPEPIPLTKNFREYLEVKVNPKYYYTEDSLIYNKIKDIIVSEHTVYQWRRTYVRVNQKGVVPTLTANMGRGGHNVPLIKDSIGIRKLTPRECFSFQGFPSEYKLPTDLPDSELYHQAGNSVTVPVVRRIAENLSGVL